VGNYLRSDYRNDCGVARLVSIAAGAFRNSSTQRISRSDTVRNQEHATELIFRTTAPQRLPRTDLAADDSDQRSVATCRQTVEAFLTPPQRLLGTESSKKRGNEGLRLRIDEPAPWFSTDPAMYNRKKTGKPPSVPLPVQGA
jgi:hypothetical protein